MESPAFILVVEDERDLSDLLVLNLKKAGYSALAVPSGLAAIESLADRLPDLILLDVMIPGLSGTEVASRIRSSPATAHVPIIMVTAKTAEADQLIALKVGADDFIAKPFSISVLLARVEAVLRRAARTAPGAAPRITEVAGVAVNADTHEATVDGDPIKLTLTEYRLLAALLEAQGRVLSRAVLMGRAIGPGITVTERTIDVHLTAVRRKLGPKAGILKTVRGVGYRITPDLSDAETGTADSLESA